jgi:hypothetical protein
VLDRYLKHPSMNLARDVRDARLGRLRQCSGRKRSRQDEDGNLPDRGSFSLHLYARLSPLLAEAWKKLGLLSEKAAKVMAASQNANKKPRHPRRHLAFEGIPDLSTIEDITEPECSQDAILLPSAPAQVSPRKRKERLDAHLDNTQDRLREKMVKLSPSGSAANGTSPIKPTSPTTAPEKPSPAHAHGIASTGRALSGALFTSGEPITSSPVQSPTKTFRVPSLSLTTFLSTTDHSASENVTHPAESPIRRPGAPTPSRWARANPTTPVPHNTHLPTTPGSKLIDTDVAKLTDSIPRSVDRPVSTPTHWEREPTSFDFDNQSGISTPLGSDSRMSFIGASQLASTPASEPGRRLVERRRRKSEPLVQKHLMKMQQSRRQSMGPSKLHDLQEEDTSALDARQKKIKLGSNSATKATLPLPHSDGLAQKSPASEAGDVKTDVTAPLAPFFRDRTPLSKRRDPTTPFHDRNTYDIDVRQNLDIFGAKTPTKASQQSVAKSSAVQQLVKMVEDRCDGHAKAVVMEENGKLIVRFKLPMKYAAMFPPSQGPDDSHFTSTPSAISSSPRIRFGHVHTAPMSQTPGHAPAASTPARLASSIPAKPATMKSSLHSVGATSQTPASQQIAQHTEPRGLEEKVDSELNVNNELTTQHLPQATPTRDTSRIPGFLPPASDDDQTLIVGDFDMTANQQVRTPRALAVASSSPTVGISSPLRTPLNPRAGPQGQGLDPPSSGLISDISFNATFQTPTHGHLDFSPSVQTHNAAAPSSQPASSPEAQGSDSEKKIQTPKAPAARASPPLNMSFTPVNKPVSQSREATPVGSATSKGNGQTLQSTSSPNDTQNAKMDEAPAVRDHQQQHDDENREYLSAFLRRSTKPKRPSTTDTGSPIAQTPARRPLVAKSPNRLSESPEKTKRKREADEPENLPAKQDPVAKKPRVASKVGRPAKATSTASKATAQKASKGLPKAAEQDEAGDNAADAPVRRSSRLNTKEVKSALPTAIKLNRPGTAKDNLPTLNSAVRNEQAELSRQTNSNTRKNRGKAESVQQVLARVSSDESSGDDSDEVKKDSKSSKSGKTVAWKDPLESHQVQKPTRGRPKKQQGPEPSEEKKAAKPAPKSRIAKPAAAAASLGRTNNGTPAKRVTRSRARGGA